MHNVVLNCEFHIDFIMTINSATLLHKPFNNRKMVRTKVVDGI